MVGSSRHCDCERGQWTITRTATSDFRLRRTTWFHPPQFLLSLLNLWHPDGLVERRTRELISWPRFEEALSCAFRWHAGQVRKGTVIPYIAHLLGVASIVLDYGADEDTAIAALLHDAVEDQGGAVRREEIRRRFGDKVAEIVDGCTDTDVIPKPPWRGRKEAYIAHLSKAAPPVLLVSAADKLHNARAILSDYRELGEELWSRFKGRKEGTLWNYRSLVEAFRENPSSPPSLVEELDRVVSEIEDLASGR